MALFVFIVTISHNQALCRPFTPSMYTVGEGSIAGYSSIDFIQTSVAYPKEYVSLHTGIFPGTDLRFSTSMLQGSFKELSDTTMGDSAIGIWHSFGLLLNALSGGLLVELGLPTAPDAYYNETAFTTELGLTTFSLALIAAFSAKPFTAVFASCYILIPQEGESVFDGLSFNVFHKGTWSSVFGLNPLKKDSMLYYKKLSNDIVYFSSTVVFDVYPILPFVSLCVGDRINNTPVYGDHGLPVLYKGYNDTLFFVTSLGIRYFFNEKTFIGTGVVYNCIRDCEYSLHYSVNIDVSSVW
ncbi:MAG: hypothetical protein N3F66_13555 [Spirochaetes bacterium]|nr:hypothetical protein [Spirochaetota bacterium]